MVHKRTRGWTSKQCLPFKKFLGYSPSVINDYGAIATFSALLVVFPGPPAVNMDSCKFCYRLQWCLHGSVQILDPSRSRRHINCSLRLCCDWLSLMFQANHVATYVVRGNSNMAADKNFTRSDHSPLLTML